MAPVVLKKLDMLKQLLEIIEILIMASSILQMHMGRILEKLTQNVYSHKNTLHKLSWATLLLQE